MIENTMGTQSFPVHTCVSFKNMVDGLWQKSVRVQHIKIKNNVILCVVI